MTAPIPRRELRPELPLAAYRWLISGQQTSWSILHLPDAKSRKEFWAIHRDMVVAWWIFRHPGTRPSMWWRMDAPGPRRRVGGTGTPLHECSNSVASYQFGVPSAWRVRGRNDYLNVGVPISPEHPPMYESEAAYLRRHNLFLAGERSRLQRQHYAPCVVRARGEDRYELVRHDRNER